MSWDSQWWAQIEASQAQADADDAQRRAAEEARIAARKAGTPMDATPAPFAAPDPDPEAAAAVAEAESLAWPHPIEPTWDGPHPTNADGTPRQGSWRGGDPPTWEDRPPPKPFSAVEGIRAWARSLRHDMDVHDEFERAVEENRQHLRRYR